MAEREASRNQVSVEMEFAAALPVVLGDKIQPQQVLLNLMINRIEAMTRSFRPSPAIADLFASPG